MNWTHKVPDNSGWVWKTENQGQKRADDDDEECLNINLLNSNFNKAVSPSM